MKPCKLKSAFAPTPIYIVAARFKKTVKAVLAGFQSTQSRRKLVWGFTLVELLICLAVVGVILTAVAIAFDACVANYEANKNISDSIIKANQALSRITADLRCATAVDTSEPNNQCSMITAEGSDITYLFNQGEGKLYLVENGTAIPYILCEDISSASFYRTTALDANGVQYVKSVQITLTVGTGNYARDACAAVVIRKNLQN
jgi:prepilin-type N-terminal cleavage/methylation domain-containing protein